MASSCSLGIWARLGGEDELVMQYQPSPSQTPMSDDHEANLQPIRRHHILFPCPHPHASPHTCSNAMMLVLVDLKEKKTGEEERSFAWSISQTRFL